MKVKYVPTTYFRPPPVPTFDTQAELLSQAGYNPLTMIIDGDIIKAYYNVTWSNDFAKKLALTKSEGTYKGKPKKWMMALSSLKTGRKVGLY